MIIVVMVVVLLLLVVVVVVGEGDLSIHGGGDGLENNGDHGERGRGCVDGVVVVVVVKRYCWCACVDLVPAKDDKHDTHRVRTSYSIVKVLA